MQRQLQDSGLPAVSSRSDAAGVRHSRSNGLDPAGLGHIHTGEGEHKGVLRLVAPTDTAPVDEQLDCGNRVACHHIHRLMVRVAGVPDAGALQ